MNKKEENKSEQELANVESSEKKENVKPKKKKKKNPIIRSLALKMYSILLFDLLAITVSIFI